MLHRNGSFDETLTDIRMRMEKAKEERGFITFALITRNISEANRYYEGLLQQGCDCQIIQQENDSYQGGFSVLPTYLAKGMEFDMVFIPDADIIHYPVDDMNGKLLYVAMTRALHSLHLYTTEDLTPLLDPYAFADE